MTAMNLSYAQSDTIPKNLLVYDYTVVLDTIISNESDTTYEKKLVKTKVMSSSEFISRLEFNNRKINRLDEIIKNLQYDLSIAEEELNNIGEDLLLAIDIQSDIDIHKARKDSYQSKLDYLLLNETEIKEKYLGLAIKKEKVKKDKDKSN